MASADLNLATEEEKQAAQEREIESKDFLDFVKDAIGDDISKVTLSRKLSSQPCCLTTEGGISLEMEKYFQRGPSEEMRKIKANRVLELNPEHSAYKALRAAYDSDKEKAKKLSLVMARMAEMLAGTDIEDPAAFVTLVSELF